MEKRKKSKMAAPMNDKKMSSRPTGGTEDGGGLIRTRPNAFVCIECGKEAMELYKIYSGGMIKIAHCPHCKQVVDKYVEYDPVIVLLDALLFKPQAYRHVLFNTNSNIHLKLITLCLLCDAYTKWAQRSQVNQLGDPLDRQFLFFALQWHFYVMFLVAGLELTAFLAGVLSSAFLFTKMTAAKDMCMPLLVRTLLLCCVGKLLVIPAVIWGQTDITTCVWLTRLFVFSSATQAMRVTLKSSTAVSSSLILSGFSVQYLSTYLSPFLEFALTQSL